MDLPVFQYNFIYKTSWDAEFCPGLVCQPLAYTKHGRLLRDRHTVAANEGWIL